MEIDIADFSSSDMDEPSQANGFDSYNKSYASALMSIFNVNPKMEKVDLPVRDEGLTYAEWYFRILYPYTPVLHQPTFITLVSFSTFSLSDIANATQ
jgi:hypothetical protein